MVPPATPPPPPEVVDGGPVYKVKQLLAVGLTETTATTSMHQVKEKEKNVCWHLQLKWLVSSLVFSWGMNGGSSSIRNLQQRPPKNG